MKYLIVCIGNPDGGDDAVGPYIAKKLSQELKKKKVDIEVLDVGVVPENFTGVIKDKNPEILLIIDAVDMNLLPGQIRIIPPESIGVMHVSTHGIPLSVYIKYLHQYINNIVLIGIQPEQYIDGLSPSVRDASQQLISTILADDLKVIPQLKT
jgi:hydrogenase 3 maturation protease